MNDTGGFSPVIQPTHFWQGFDGVTLAGDSWGGDDRVPIVLLHGAGQTRHAWKGAGQKLEAAGYQAIALDARGHGDSGWDQNGNYSQDALVADLVNVVESLDGRKPVLVGASLGGITSLIAAGEDRVDAAALVLVDVAPHIEPSGRQRIMDFMAQRPEGFESLEEVSEAISTYQPQRKRPKDLSGLAKNVRLADDGRYYWHWDPQFHFRNSDPEARRRRLESCAQRLTIPTLLVRGGLSDILTEEGARSFLEMCPQSEYVNVTGAAHMVAGDRNDIFANAMIDFVSRATPHTLD